MAETRNVVGIWEKLSKLSPSSKGLTRASFEMEDASCLRPGNIATLEAIIIQLSRERCKCFARLREKRKYCFYKFLSLVHFKSSPMALPRNNAFIFAFIKYIV